MSSKPRTFGKYWNFSGKYSDAAGSEGKKTERRQKNASGN